MVENLRTTHYNDGTAIPQVTDSLAWLTASSDAYCWYNNSTSDGTVYGALYNSYVVNNTVHQLSPKGWHVPSAAEWDTLITYLGGITSAATPLKESGTTHWSTPNSGTNSSGFTALPGGVRHGFPTLYVPGQFQYLNQDGGWWTSTTVSGEQTSYWMFSNSISLQTINESLNCGSSVRCIMNSKSTGVINLTSSDVTVYPNPVKDNLSVSVPDPQVQTSIQIFNLSGTEVYSSFVTNSITTVDVSGFTSGIYFIKIISPVSGVVNRTIVVTK
jgi:uncharacterized protein (TIGR02145 family)